MIMIKVEMWPLGNSDHKRDLAAISITNVGGNYETGDYEARISHQIDSEYGNEWIDHETFADNGAGTWKVVRVTGFKRSLGAIKLLVAVLRKAFGR
jgi:hypothetical protein